MDEDLLADVAAQIEDVLSGASIAAADPNGVLVTELDSLLVAEVLAVLEAGIGHPLALDVVDPEATTVGDILLFARIEAGRPRAGDAPSP